jgi:integrase/recombinase XerD
LRRSRDPERCGLPVDDWEETDKALWLRARSASDLEDADSGSVSHWRPATVRYCQFAYGRWLTFCKRSGWDMQQPPAERVTQARVKLYLDHLREQQLSLWTMSGYVRGVHATICAFNPEQDWTWLKDIFVRLLRRAKRERVRQGLPILAGDILDRSLRALARLERSDDVGCVAAAAEYRNWLILAMLTLMPLRRRNFASLSINKHLRMQGDSWVIDIPAEESKAARPINMPVPGLLRSRILYYLRKIRPRLLKGPDDGRLWIRASGGPMSDDDLYWYVTTFTKRSLGVKVNPHRFRHIAATSMVLAAPSGIDAARSLLAHATTNTTEGYYILGRSVATSRQHANLIERLRRTLPGAKRAQSTPSAATRELAK